MWREGGRTENVCLREWGKVQKKSLSLFLVSPREEGVQQIQCILIICPPPRKSLVKGERFIRSEGRPELLLRQFRCSLIYADSVRSTYGFQLISSARGCKAYSYL